MTRDLTLRQVFNNEEVRRQLEYIIEKEEITITDRAKAVIESGDTDGWSCHQCTYDPCLFVFTSPSGSKSWFMIHTDDIDAAGEKEEDLEFIFSVLDRIWKVKPVDSEYILGVTRKLYGDKDGQQMSVELSMGPYIEGMAEIFSAHLPDGTVNTPFPEKVTLSKDDATPEEAKEVLEMLYQRAVGMILWAVRHVFVEGKFGISQLCSVMSNPSHKAFKAAMHMIKYMQQRARRGIRFSEEGNWTPVCMFDASFKQPRDDSKCHGGYVIHWMGGPIMAYSKKQQHVGHSSEHVEYMAMTAAIKAVIWLRELLSECGFNDCIKKPTICFGDNVQANNLCSEHFISTGNQYIYKNYHFNKEARELGIIEVKWIKTNMNLADIFTKALTNQQLNSEQHGLLKYLLGYADINKFKELLEAALDLDAMKAMR